MIEVAIIYMDVSASTETKNNNNPYKTLAIYLSSFFIFSMDSIWKMNIPEKSNNKILLIITLPINTAHARSKANITDLVKS